MVSPRPGHNHTGPYLDLLLNWVYIQQLIPATSERGRPVSVAVQQLLYQTVATAVQPRAETVAARPSDLMETLEPQADEEL